MMFERSTATPQPYEVATIAWRATLQAIGDGQPQAGWPVP
jgi:hypothetical protein